VRPCEAQLRVLFGFQLRSRVCYVLSWQVSLLCSKLCSLNGTNSPRRSHDALSIALVVTEV
jgi:hypothetical protein